MSINSGTLKVFLREVFADCLVVEGYACTEAGPIADDEGQLLPAVQFRLEDVYELDYTTADKPYPRGQLVVSTPQTISAYDGAYDELLAAGWFRTGDIVELIGPRQIRIIDRLKHFFKLSQGEFVAPEKIESLYLACPLVSLAFVTCADLQRFPNQTGVVAVIIIISIIYYHYY